MTDSERGRAWDAARPGREITVSASADVAGASRVFRGEVVERERRPRHLRIILAPTGEVAPVMLESAKKRGEWTPWRVFEWDQPERPENPGDHHYRYRGTADTVAFPNLPERPESADTGARA